MYAIRSYYEILALLPVLKRWGVPLITLTGNPNSTMAREAEVHLCVRVDQEACPLGLAPTASTTASLVMGDALAVCRKLAQANRIDYYAPADYRPGKTLSYNFV